jgi:hypothetical protein
MPRRLPSEAEAAAILATHRPTPPPKPPPHAARGFVSALKSLEDRFGPTSGDLRARWREIVGDALASRSEPVKLIKTRNAGATLELKVAGPVAALVQHQAPLILDRLNLYLGQGTVARLRIVQGPVSGPTKPTPRPRAPPPLDTFAEQQLAGSLDRVREGPLRDALLRLGRQVARRRPR